MMTATGGALEGVRIVEFAGIGPAPFAAMLLADMGAEIVRVDRPGAKLMIPNHISGRGRPTVQADLKDADDVERVRALIDSADALIEGFRPGVMERLGLGPDLLIERNPRLVYARMTGWGQEGPLAPFAGHDINYIAITGALAAIGPSDRPVPPLNLVGDYGGGALYLVNGVLAGLLSAGRTGKGQVVDCAMCDGAVSLMSPFFEMAAAGRWKPEREANMLDGGAPYYGVYRCADGLDVAVGAIEPQFFAELCRGLGIEEAEMAGRNDQAQWPALREKLATVIASKPRAEWLERLEYGDACFTGVVTYEQAADNPHLAARGSVVEVAGLMQPAPAPRFLGTPSAIRSERREMLTLDQAAARWVAR
jgi:alpha-methylacyl-CoA racemase